MPEHLRALVVILVFASVVFALGRRPATDLSVLPQDFARRRNLWIAVTVIAFVSHNYWLFAGFTGLVLLMAGRKEANVVALFVWLLFAVPAFFKEVPGFGVINYLMTMEYIRLLTISLLVPAYIGLRRQARVERSGWLPTDYLLLVYMLIQLTLRLNVDTATNTARYAVYALLDVGLPYYVASRSLRELSQFRDVAMSFVVAAMVLALIGIFESVKWWLLYSSLERALDANWGYSNYLGRTAILRAQASTGQPIVFGYVMVVALALYAYLRCCVKSRALWWLGFALLGGGLLASYSRGPWVGAAVGLVVFRLAGPNAVGGLLKAALVVGAICALVLVSPMGDTVIDLLPFIGTVDKNNVDYREELLTTGVRLILHEPWFGVTGYMNQLVDNELVIGGMVDLVNTFLGIGLAYGVIALACFVGVFAVTARSAYMAMRRLPNPQDEARMLGCGILACFTGIGVTIFTTSSITVIPVIYWIMAGVGAGYVAMLRRQAASRTADRQGLAAASARSRRFVPRAGARVS
ncbi:O-antigen ligase [Methylibium sp.]|uniref:O-antigen ligase family protein n=1 Tax=Methylibium sp. TaxID=2067992 RepID=UPI0017D522C8|nr:O-antigen ligase family protein [Methylibium sp.]MBA3587993.1 O-antigen ligase family protein [Methylibium sp.]